MSTQDEAADLFFPPPERFFGPWRLVASIGPSPADARLSILDSDGADGFHELVPGAPVRLDVGGPAWTLVVLSGSSKGLLPVPVKRTTGFVHGQGLTVLLTSDLPDFRTLVVVAVSTDPTLSPPATPNPFDFSLPETSSLS